MSLNDTTNEVPYGYCHCGCGQLTPIAKTTRSERGQVKGQPFPYLKGHRHLPQPSNPAMKRCTQCNEIKPRTAEYFFRCSAVSDGFKGQCKACAMATQKQRREENIDIVRARQNALNAKKRDELRAQGRIRYAKNKDKLLARARDYKARNKRNISEYNRQYKDTHRDSLSANERRRNARKRNASGNHTAADVKRQYEIQRGKCYYCGCKVGDVYEVEHIIPLSRGGSNGPENIAIACPSCNVRKGTKLPTEWDGSNRLL